MTFTSELISCIYRKKPWDDKFQEPLLGLHLEDPLKAWQVLTAINEQANFPELYPDFFPSLLECLAQSYNPEIALNNFHRLSEKIKDREHFYSLLSISGEFLKVLTILFSGSQVLTDTLLNNPTYLDWLSEEETLSKPKTKDILYRDFYAMAGEDCPLKDIPSFLRKFKKREYIRIGLRDLMGVVELDEHVGSLSDLADVCLQIACDYADQTLKEKHGAPMYEDSEGQLKESEFTVLSMGKLGGRELNYSSDIDLIYIYTSSMGETQPVLPNDSSLRTISNHEFHIKFARLVTSAINEITSEGNVFRVDLDLRPEGKSGEIANSLVSCETYYESWGRTWERQALIKARVSAGSETLGQEFFSMIRPFIYRRSLDFEAVQEIKSLKKKVDLDLKKKKLEKGHIKLGFGGIREVEFIVQAYQLLFGGRDKGLRNPNSLITLEKLKEREFITEDGFKQLREAYIFLRNLENRVQITFGLQTYHLPKKDKDLAVLARKMGITGATSEQLIEKLNAEFERHTQFVGQRFAKLFQEDKDQQAADQASQRWKGTRSLEERFDVDLFKEYSFKDPDRALSFLKSLRDGPKFSHPSERSIENFYSMMPVLLDICKEIPDPSSAVENLVKFIEASHAREMFLRVFNDNEKFLELLLILFGGSEVLSQILIKQPNLIDVLSNTESLYRYKTQDKMLLELKDSLDKHKGLEEKNRALRWFKQGEELRIGLRYLIHETDLPGTLGDLSLLAEIYLQTILEMATDSANADFGLTHGPSGFCIIGLGKLGGRELNFGSDLDIVFVYDDSSEEENVSGVDDVAYYSSIAQKIYKLSTEMTSAGYAYKIDTDLRPEGSRGALILSLQGYEDYFKNRGQIWEQQAMTRARWVAGNEELGSKFLQVAHEFTYGRKLEYGNLIEIARLRERMEKELAQESKKGRNVKLGYGGLADIEFTLQILQMMHGKSYPKIRATNTFELISILSSYGILPHDQADSLSKYYYFLRNLECALRLWNERTTNHIPKDEEDLLILARMLDCPGETFREQVEKILKDFETTTRQVREIYKTKMDALLRTSL